MASNASWRLAGSGLNSRMEYVGFGVNIGNVGRSLPEGRPTSAELCRRWNQKRAWHDGTRALVFEPLEFLERLATLKPRPETNLLLSHGVLAARARWRVSRPNSLVRRTPK